MSRRSDVSFWTERRWKDFKRTSKNAINLCEWSLRHSLCPQFLHSAAFISTIKITSAIIVLQMAMIICSNWMLMRRLQVLVPWLYFIMTFFSPDIIASQQVGNKAKLCTRLSEFCAKNIISVEQIVSFENVRIKNILMFSISSRQFLENYLRSNVAWGSALVLFAIK